MMTCFALQESHALGNRQTCSELLKTFGISMVFCYFFFLRIRPYFEDATTSDREVQQVEVTEVSGLKP